MASVGGRDSTDRILKAAGFDLPHAVSPPPRPPPTVPPRPPRPPAPQRGQRLSEGHNLYDVDRENDPLKLVDIPISRYTSDGRLAIGRQIVVNRSFVCYAIEGGSIRVFSRKTRESALLKAKYQRISDMALLSEDVNLLASLSIEGRIFVWEINEAAKELKSSISGKMIFSMHVVGFQEMDHPRICWHSHKHEILFVGIQNCVFRIDTTKAQKAKISADELMRSHSGEASDGVQLVCTHEGPVTDLSFHQSVSCRLASASTDGSVMIMEEDQAMPWVILKPHDGQPVGFVSFFSSPQYPDRTVLITAGNLNREVKLWSLSSESWESTQTLELESFGNAKSEDAFFNYISVVPGASIILVANAVKNVIYVVHVEHGFPSRATMDYLAKFSVLNGILGITGILKTLHTVQLCCVQSRGVRQYDLDLSLCSSSLDPTLEFSPASITGKDSEDIV